MPKKKQLTGIDDAFNVDAKHANDNKQPIVVEQVENFKKVTISLPPSLLIKLDKAVKSLKSKGESVNRSSYIAKAVLEQINNK